MLTVGRTRGLLNKPFNPKSGARLYIRFSSLPLCSVYLIYRIVAAGLDHVLQHLVVYIGVYEYLGKFASEDDVRYLVYIFESRLDLIFIFFGLYAFYVRYLVVDPLYLKHDRSRAVRAAGDHHFFVVHPSAHDRPALQTRIDISRDSRPRFGAVSEDAAVCGRVRDVFGLFQSVETHMPEIVGPAVALKDKLVAHVVTWTGAYVWFGAVLRLKLRVELFVYYR